MYSFVVANSHSVNPDLAHLQPDPFEKPHQLFAGVSPASS
jgi:hypothetical protein